MPILHDIMDHDLLGPVRRHGIELGLAEGEAKGLVAGERRVIRRLIGKRFGPVPEWVKQRLDAFSPSSSRKSSYASSTPRPSKNFSAEPPPGLYRCPATLLRSTPMPSISTSTTSPGSIRFVLPGVPV